MTENNLETAKENKAKSNGGKFNMWPFAIVAIVLILSAGFVLLAFINGGKETVANIGNVVSDVMKTKVTINYSITSVIGEIKKESKIVVLSAEVATNSTATSEGKKFGVNLGTTKVEIKTFGNKIQYILPTDVINADNFMFDEVTGELIVNLPPPILDESIVEVQSDPEKIEIKKEIGWARLSSYSGAFLENQLKKQLRDAVIKEGKHELLMERAHKNAEEVIIKMLKQILEKEKVTVPIKINFN